jgi:hypothetical protein
MFVVPAGRGKVTGDDEKSSRGQGGGLGYAKPVSAIDSSDAPARNSLSYRKNVGCLQPQISCDRRPG